MENKSTKYYTYILLCADGTYYCGITNDLEKRIYTHNNSLSGARYTKSRRPVTLKYFELFEDKSSALKREIAIKKLTRIEKEELIVGID